MTRVWWRLIRFGFRLLYNEFAFTYDAVSYLASLGAWRCWQRSALKHLDLATGEPVLELAFGTGNLQLDLHSAGYPVVGCDLSPYMGRIARRKLLQHHLPARLVRGSAYRLPFPAQAFAVVVSTFPTDFIVQPETLAEVYRVLKSHGRFVIVPNGVFASGGPVEASVEWLYRITGQRGDGTNIETFFAGFGFEARLLHERCPRSMAQVIVARKKA